MELLINAKTAEEVFGADCQEGNLKIKYHKLAQIVHPDHNSTPEAGEAFSKLKNMYEYALDLFKRGLYGKNIPLTADSAPKNVEKYFEYGKSRISNVLPFNGGTLTSVFTGILNGKKVLVKMAQNPKDNDLLLQEQKAFKKIDDFVAKLNSDDDLVKMRNNHLPIFIDSFMYDGRRCNVLEFVEKTMRLADAAKNPIDNKTIVWIWKRLISAMIVVANAGVVHNAITMDNVLIDPENHNAILVDFCYSTTDKPKIIDKSHKDFYAPEVFRKEKLSIASDVYMMAKTIEKTIQEKPLKRFDRVLKACILSHNRFSDLGAIYRDVVSIAESEFGKPKFHPFPYKK